MQTKKQKEELVKNLSEQMAKVKAVVFADYTGMGAVKLTELRRKLRAGNAELKVVKKTLIDIAAKNAGLDKIDAKKMAGQVALVLGYSDEVAPAKIIYEFDRKGEQVKILGGILEKIFIDAQGVISLAKLPSRQELLAKVAGSIAAPMSGMLNVLQGNLKGLVRALSQIKK